MTQSDTDTVVVHWVCITLNTRITADFTVWETVRFLMITWH